MLTAISHNIMVKFPKYSMAKTDSIFASSDELIVLFGGFDGRMAHHDLQRFFFQVVGTLVGLSNDMRSKGIVSVLLVGLAVLLIGTDVKFRIVPF